MTQTLPFPLSKQQCIFHHHFNQLSKKSNISITEKVTKLKLKLPPTPQPTNTYTHTVRNKQLIFVTNQLPLANNKILYTNQINTDLSIKKKYQTAKLYILNTLNILNTKIESLKTIQLVHLKNFVTSTKKFTNQTNIINNTSKLTIKVLDNQNVHTRITVNIIILPLKTTIKLKIITQID